MRPRRMSASVNRRRSRAMNREDSCAVPYATPGRGFQPSSALARNGRDRATLAWRLLSSASGSPRRRIDRRGDLVPDLDLVTVGITEEDVRFTGHEFTGVRDGAAGGTNRFTGAPDVARSPETESEVGDAAFFPALRRFRSKTRTSRLPGVCAWTNASASYTGTTPSTRR